MPDAIVCRCNRVTEEDVIDYMVKHIGMGTVDLTELRADLKIGTRCRQCLKEDCQIIDKSYLEVIEGLK